MFLWRGCSLRPLRTVRFLLERPHHHGATQFPDDDLRMVVARAPSAPVFAETAPVALTGTVGTSLTRTFTATGTPTPAVGVVDRAQLPPGMTFTDDPDTDAPTLSGKATAAGKFDFMVSATNGTAPPRRNLASDGGHHRSSGHRSADDQIPRLTPCQVRAHGSSAQHSHTHPMSHRHHSPVRRIGRADGHHVHLPAPRQQHTLRPDAVTVSRRPPETVTR
ncbi:hypothetical protein RERY_07280 [Rhodococcus erythropolis]|nr:hypothetical protein RERY_07280 [Rhodococcus erythropolis]